MKQALLSRKGWLRFLRRAPLGYYSPTKRKPHIIDVRRSSGKPSSFFLSSLLAWDMSQCFEVLCQDQCEHSDHTAKAEQASIFPHLFLLEANDAGEGQHSHGHVRANCHSQFEPRICVQALKEVRYLVDAEDKGNAR